MRSAGEESALARSLREPIRLAHFSLRSRVRHLAKERIRMKINWFHLMPCRWLPDDFREKYRSVRIEKIRGAGHIVLLEQTGAAVRSITRFCSE
jgi:hypothetical protein